jgi:pyruvate,water dikinase
MTSIDYVRDIAELRLTDDARAGGKGANVGELVGAGLPVPGGFVVLREAFLDSMDRGGVRAELRHVQAGAVSSGADADHLRGASQRLKELVAKAGRHRRCEMRY